jgi:sigma-B regulation protein RsbU (phosphoserine phosphatase)
MEEGDALVAYSDGIPEAWKSEKDMYGMGRLKRSVNEYSDLPSALAIRNAILADVKEWAGDWKQMDDITALVLKKTKGGVEAAGKDAIQKTVEKAEASKKEEVSKKEEAEKPESKGEKGSKS